MARTVITPTALVGETAAASGAGTTIDSTLVSNGVSIKAEGLTGRLLIRIVNTAVASKVATLKGAPASSGYGVNPGSDYHFLAAKGDMAITCATDTELTLTGLESARFAQADDAATPNKGALLIDLASGFTGTLWVFLLPKTAV